MKVKNKKLLLSSLVLAALLIAGGVYAYSKNSDKNDQGTDTTTSTDSSYSPPTEEEQKAGDSVKEKFGDNSENDQTDNNNGPKSVTPQITYSGVYQGNVEVSSHVPNIFEKSGQCTLRLKKEGKMVSQSKTAVPNVSEMSCGLIKISTSKLSAGTWNATVEYSSAKAKGTSSEVSIRVK